MELGTIPKLKKGLALDIDETLSWTIGYWIEKMQKLFGNPENLSVKEMVSKYRYTQNVPYWQTQEALAWMEEKRNSDNFQTELPLIKEANVYVNKINKLIPITAYITIRPENVKQGTKEWLDKYNFPNAPIICRPTTIPTEKGNKWKAKMLENLYPTIIGIIDDNPKVIEYLDDTYMGKLFLYDHPEINTNLNHTSCPTWKDVYLAVEKFKKNEMKN